MTGAVGFLPEPRPRNLVPKRLQLLPELAVELLGELGGISRFQRPTDASGVWALTCTPRICASLAAAAGSRRTESQSSILRACPGRSMTRSS